MRRRWTRLAMVAMGLWLTAGCATVGGAPEAGTDPAALDPLAKHPLLRLAVADAERTLVWVDEQARAGRLTEPRVTLARACPTAVKWAAGDLAQHLDELRGRLRAMRERAGERALMGPSVIYDLTRLRYDPGADPQSVIARLRADLRLRIDALVTGCAHLFPARELAHLMRLATSAGLAGP